MPDLYKQGTNPVLRAYLLACAGELDDLDVEVDNAKDQLFIQRANNYYLDYLAANFKVSRPVGTPFYDDAFRELIPVLTWWPKQVKNSIYKALSLFWPYWCSHSTAISSSGSTYNLVGNEYLTLTVDETHELSVFFGPDNITPGAATAQEVADTINAWIPNYVVADTYYEHDTGLTKVIISTTTYGVEGSVEITGGSANTILNFPESKYQYPKISIHELYPNELVVRIPKSFLVSIPDIKWVHRFHADATIYDTLPVPGYWPGHFFYDSPSSTSVALRSLQSTLTMVSGLAPIGNTVITVADDVSQWPASGALVFDFGGPEMETCPYLTRTLPNMIMLDSTYTQPGTTVQFEKSHPNGQKVNVCELHPPVVPRKYGEDHPIFFVDTANAYDVILPIVLLLKAAGIVVRWILEDEFLEL